MWFEITNLNPEFKTSEYLSCESFKGINQCKDSVYLKHFWLILLTVHYHRSYYHTSAICFWSSHQQKEHLACSAIKALLLLIICIIFTIVLDILFIIVNNGVFCLIHCYFCSSESLYCSVQFCYVDRYECLHLRVCNSHCLHVHVQLLH